MKIWVFSDLHLRPSELRRNHFLPIVPEADLCIVAGDLIQGDIVRGIEWLSWNVRPHMPTVVIAGNHEFYGRQIDETLEAGRRAARLNGIDFLDDAATSLGGMRIFGTTLWSDFDVFARGDGIERGRAMAYASALMSDYQLIRLSNGERWTPVMALARHMSSRLALEAEFATPMAPQIVVSHHAPHRNSIAPEFAQDLLTPSFVSDLTDVIERFQPKVWIHGHTHRSFDYKVGSTRVVCNAMGYRHEKTGFNPGLVIEI